MFDDIRTAKRLRAEANKITVPGTDSSHEKHHEGKRYARFTVRFAACAILAVAVVLGGTLWLPTRRLQPETKGSTHTGSAASAQTTTHDFVLQAYAAEASGSVKGKVTLALNMKVTLPSGKLRYYKHNGMTNGRWTSGSEFSQDNGFICSGKNLVSVKYTAANGRLNYRSSEMIEQIRSAAKNSVVCTIAIPKYKLKTGRLFKDFYALWKSGAFDSYRKKYFGGKNIDLKRYGVTIETCTGKSDYSYSDGHGETGGMFVAGPGNRADSKTDIVTIQDSKKYNFDNSLLMFRKSIIAKASDHNANVWWSYSDKAINQINAADKRYERTGKVDYSGISGDRITVTGTFTDGQKVTKYINLSFIKSGNLCAKLTDK